MMSAAARPAPDGARRAPSSTRSHCCCARYRSRADLARACGLGPQTLRTCTDGVWRAKQPPSPYVLAMLGNAGNPDELDAAVSAALAARGAPALTVGQRAMLEAVRGYPEELLVEVAPLVHELVRDGGRAPVREAPDC